MKNFVIVLFSMVFFVLFLAGLTNCSTIPTYDTFRSHSKENERLVYFINTTSDWTMRIITTPDDLNAVRSLNIRNQNFLLDVAKLGVIIVPVNGVAVFSLPENIGEIGIVFVNFNVSESEARRIIWGLGGSYIYGWGLQIISLPNETVQCYVLGIGHDNSFGFFSVNEQEIASYFSFVKKYAIGKKGDQLGFIKN